MPRKGVVLINVHVPYEGELENTDMFIPYDHIAANALHGAGYTHLAHLEGGMQAWEASDRTLIHNPVDGADATANH
jgi:hypothetical protein